MNVKDIVLEGLTKSYGYMVCALGFSDGSTIDHGTGFLLTKGDDFYIITCKHVADAFFASNIAQAEIYPERTYEKSDLEYIESSSSSLDLAVIGFRSTQMIEHCFREEYLRIIPDFNNFDFDPHATVVLGMPHDMSERVGGTKELYPLAFLTGPLVTKASDKDFLFLDYPFSAGEIFVANAITTSPRPNGMSGGPVLLVPDVNQSGIWSLSDTRLIAIQTSWDTKTYLKATSAKYVWDLIP